LNDNYVWLMHEEVTGETVVIDPGSRCALFWRLRQQRGWTISQIWNTHWHPGSCRRQCGDQGGDRAAVVTGPAAEAAQDRYA
jgi:hydroxyacylglutathione hydrolase